MTTYYNEFDPNAAQWLRNLGAAGEISQGVVDERSIKSVAGADLALLGAKRAHFFAGIGGWDLALRLAGWGTEEVWTGSCPCQPYSSAGKQEGDADPRNLWPDFFRLIAERRPQFVFGEQVASAIKHGWLDRVQADLEGIGYSCGAAVLGAHSVGANHIRQRLYWGAALGSVVNSVRGGTGYAPGQGVGAEAEVDGENGSIPGEGLRPGVEGSTGGVLDPELARRKETGGGPDIDAGRELEPGRRSPGGVQHDPSDGRIERGAEPGEWGALRGCGVSDRSMDDNAGDGERGREFGIEGGAEAGGESQMGADIREAVSGTGTPSTPWSDFRYILCTDGKARRTGSRVFPLAHGLPRGVGDGGAWRKGLARSASRSRVGMLKGSGNAIVPELAAEFIRAFRESVTESDISIERPKGESV